MVEGVCSGITSPPFGGTGKFTCLTGMELNLPCCWIETLAFTLVRHTDFIFRRRHAHLWEIFLDASLSTNTFLGYEEIQESDTSE
ncbi:MAG: hypothetical protein ACLRJV_18140 [Eubacteriales bacterium]